MYQILRNAGRLIPLLVLLLAGPLHAQSQNNGCAPTNDGNIGAQLIVMRMTVADSLHGKVVDSLRFPLGLFHSGCDGASWRWAVYRDTTGPAPGDLVDFQSDSTVIAQSAWSARGDSLLVVGSGSATAENGTALDSGSTYWFGVWSSCNNSAYVQCSVQYSGGNVAWSETYNADSAHADPPDPYGTPTGSIGRCYSFELFVSEPSAEEPESVRQIW